MKFKVLLNCDLLSINTDKKFSPIQNEHVLSIVNGFEDGKWRSSKFHSFIWDNIAETALSYKERESLLQQSYTLQIEAAKNLRLTDKKKDISKGSELAEILLYGIMKHHYSALPVVPKIFFKQNNQDNAKGADSVHIVIEEGKDFTLWFGEAKFYNKIEDTRLSSIITSVGNSLQTNKIKKENSIITNVNDIEDLEIDKKLKSSIKNALDNNESLDFLKPKIHIPILLLHECAITNAAKEFTQEYIDEISQFHKDRASAYFKRQIKKLKKKIYKYSEINFHLILFPVPRKKPIIKRFVSAVKFFKDQAEN